ncbi:MAG TPA: hypothetical protein VM597_02445, partial [Gemmataceae bacterium]|nr:hypothetical protein [Gemmataceae bacterium]
MSPSAVNPSSTGSATSPGRNGNGTGSTSPVHAAGWAAAGRDHQRAGRLADAAAAYRRSLALDPRQARVLNS